MSLIISATLGRLSPRFRSLHEFIPLFRGTLTARDLSEKTLANHDTALRQLDAAIGTNMIGYIRPYEIAAATRAMHTQHPHAAQRLLAEARALFAEAVAMGWSDRNPAAEVKMPIARIARERLSLDQWQQITAYARDNLPPWVSRMTVLALVTGQRRGDLCRMQFDDVRDGHLHVCQEKTGALVRIPLDLRLDIIDISVGEAIEMCRSYAKGNVYLLRKSTGAQLAAASLSARFEIAREGALGMYKGDKMPPSLAECRSLAERLYSAQGIDTQTLLGHTRYKMTELYHNDRGLSAGQWKTLKI